MRRHSSWVSRAGLTFLVGLLALTGCLGGPNRVSPTGHSASGGQKPGAIASPSQVSEASAPPKPLPSPQIHAPVVGDLATAALHGTVMLPASIISHNGGNLISEAGGGIISHNGGNIVGDKGAGIISHNGGNIIGNNGGGIIGNNGGGLQIKQVPLAYATVRLTDAAGMPVKDATGQEITTKTDENGNYAFPVAVDGRNLIVKVVADGLQGELLALLPKEGVQAGSSIDVDLISTMSMGYILDQYVKGDLETFERLPKALEARARENTENVLAGGTVAIPDTLDPKVLSAKIEEVRKADVTTDKTFEIIRITLIVAGIQHEGDGLKATEAAFGLVAGITEDAEHRLIVFSHKRHTIWRIEADGTVKTLVASGDWGFTEADARVDTPGYESGMAVDADGFIILADTYNNRIVQISPIGTVRVLAGTGVYGSDLAGGDAPKARLGHPSGLVINDLGDVYFSDADNHQICRLDHDAKLTRVVGDGTPGAAELTPSTGIIQLNRPCGLAYLDRTFYVADYANNRVVELAQGDAGLTLKNRVDVSGAPISIAPFKSSYYVVGHRSADLYLVTNGIASKVEKRADALVDDFSFNQMIFPRVVFASSSGPIIDGGSGVLARFDSTGVLGRVFGKSEVHTATGFDSLSGAAFDRDGNLFVTEYNLGRVIKIDATGAQTIVAGAREDGFVAFSVDALTVPIFHPADIYYDAATDSMLVPVTGEHPSVKQFFSNGTMGTIVGDGRLNYETQPGGLATSTSLASPRDVIRLRDGRLLIAEPGSGRIHQMSADNILSPLPGAQGLKYPVKMIQRRDDSLLFIERFGGGISMYKDSAIADFVSKSTIARYFDPLVAQGLAMNSRGDIYLASESAVYRVQESGTTLVPIAGLGAPLLSGESRDNSLGDALDIVFDSADNLYIIEIDQVYKITKGEIDAIQ